MHTSSEQDRSKSLGQPPAAIAGRRRALWESLGISAAALCVVIAGVAGPALTSRDSIRLNYEDHLISLAEAAAALVDPSAQSSIRRPDEINDPQYRRAVAPLRRMRKAVPEIHYIYTVVRDGRQVRFILDAADPKLDRRRGVDDQSGVWQKYDGHDPAMQEALGDGRHPGVAAATQEPLSDAWGTFMTGWAPLRDRQGRQIGAIGVDVDARVYVARLAAARNLALIGIAPAGLLIMLLGFIVYRVRLRGMSDAEAAIASAAAALRAAGALADERRRQATILEGADVGTWELDFSSGSSIICNRTAAMLGCRAVDMNPLHGRTWRALVHPDDWYALRRAFVLFRRGDQGMFVHEFRLRHAAGAWIWILVRGKVIERDAAQRPLRMAGIDLDISARKLAESVLRENELKFRSLFELSPVGIALSDAKSGRFMQVNEALLASSGYSSEELLERSYQDVATSAIPEAEPVSAPGGGSGRYGPYETECRRRDGSRFAALLSGIRMTDAGGRAVVWSIVQDISQRKALEAALSEAARRDKLTGLANRARFMEALQAAIDRVQRGVQARYAVLFLDFDRFKLVNDTLGHTAGDELLRQIGRRLRTALRTGDSIGAVECGNLVGRFGGDEFLILINDLQSPADAEVIAERLLNTLAPLYDVGGREVHSSASIGIVTSDHGRSSAEEVVRNADVAMYEAKRAGRACSVVFNEAMHTRLSRHVTIETSLRRALAEHGLSVVYQPIVELNTGRIVSAEALVRWNHPDVGPISPSEFIPIAEESDLIVAIGDFVLRQACEALVAWRAAAEASAPRTVSVNISQAELALGRRLLERVKETLNRTGLPPECLQLEVTEREVVRDPKATLSLMHELRRLGVKLAMDDFGTGTSSLGMLRDYPFDMIKIDRSFVKDMTVNGDMLAVIHATVGLVENLG
ncbi:MAG: EAL domain-containing protein, partial [Steroidobacteraceae bacterium]|nr:EAL domain-containing protein [Steroidobacteraceae bacterium]